MQKSGSRKVYLLVPFLLPYTGTQNWISMECNCIFFKKSERNTNSFARFFWTCIIWRQTNFWCGLHFFSRKFEGKQVLIKPIWMKKLEKYFLLGKQFPVSKCLRRDHVTHLFYQHYSSVYVCWINSIEVFITYFTHTK